MMYRMNGKLVKMSNIYFLLIIMLLIVSQCHDLIDYSYTEHEIMSSYHKQKHQQIVIHPQNSQHRYYEYPKLCTISQRFQAYDIEPVLNPLISDENLQFLRSKLTRLLTLQTQIKQQKIKMQQFMPYLEYKSSTIVNENELNKLNLLEKQLSTHNHQIQQMVIDLQNYLKQVIIDNSNQLGIITLKYQLQFLQNKLLYLKSLVIHSYNDYNNLDIQNYFSKIKINIKQQQQLLINVEEFMKGQSSKAYLKHLINDLEQNIAINERIMKEKRQCISERQIIRNKQKDVNVITNLIKELEEKKLQFGIKSIEFCDGIQKKLGFQIRKFMIACNYTFQCAQGLPQLEEQTQILRRKLEQNQNKLRNSNNFNLINFKNKLEQISQIFRKKSAQIDQIQLNKYLMNKDSINNEIEETQSKLDAIKRKMIQIGRQPIQQQKPWLNSKIRQIIQKIKNKKMNYCINKQQYESRAKQIYNKIYKYQSDLGYNLKMRDIYIQQYDSLRSMEQQFKMLRTQINRLI